MFGGMCKLIRPVSAPSEGSNGPKTTSKLHYTRVFVVSLAPDPNPQENKRQTTTTAAQTPWSTSGGPVTAALLKHKEFDVCKPPPSPSALGTNSSASSGHRPRPRPSLTTEKPKETRKRTTGNTLTTTATHMGRPRDVLSQRRSRRSTNTAPGGWCDRRPSAAWPSSSAHSKRCPCPGPHWRHWSRGPRQEA